mmetsp:Transcript_165/g.438  ORF Transcript_165/g.438 Transcript_165/m.438 type:complete len:247 (+) Transcript_165:1470-2210(+)
MGTMSGSITFNSARIAASSISSSLPFSSARSISIFFVISAIALSCCAWRTAGSTGFSMSSSSAASRASSSRSRASALRWISMLHSVSRNQPTGVSWSRNFLYLKQNCMCSSCFVFSLVIPAICALNFLISAVFSCFPLVSNSAFFMASTAFMSLSLRKSSNFRIVSSSCSSCCLIFFSALSASSSSFRISWRLVDSDMRVKPISRFFAMNVAIFSFSLANSPVSGRYPEPAEAMLFFFQVPDSSSS